MIKKLLAFAGGDRPERSPIDLNEVITETQELLAHTLPQSIDMELAIDDDLLPMDGDLTRAITSCDESRTERPRCDARRWETDHPSRELYGRTV